jgi:Ca2+-binding RTX toxin-like protein
MAIPQITSNGGGDVAAINLAENETIVTSVAATDSDGHTITYSIVGGADRFKFTINATTGALTFVTAPNFEAPTDNGLNNTYEVIVQASDSVDIDTQTITVTITDVVPVTLDGGGGDDVLGPAAATSEGDTLNGLGGNDTLDGGVGPDTMVGGLGNDTYVVDNIGDVVTEAAGEGTDSVQSSKTHTLAANVENLTLTGLTAINGTGNGLDNILTGNSSLNTLNGGLGADAMAGGAGNDTYVVDNAGDTVTEALSAGTDTVQSSITFTLGANVENLTLTGAAAINGTGQGLNNTITGNGAANTLMGLGGNDTLNGGLGNDTMEGGLGNDTYVVNSSLDVVTEALSEGTDAVQAGATFTLGANVENLTLTGAAAINGIGQGLNNTITGNGAANTLMGLGGNDTLNGGLGNDTMEGGLGNDTYVVNAAGDVVTEAASAGTDTVQASVTHTLAANVENLLLTGITAINGTGNALANTITGNSAANTLIGDAGNDTLSGGTGADTMMGGLNSDTYTVDNVGDVVDETGGSGTDTVNSGVNFTLGAGVENLTLTGTALTGTGNTSSNVITGNNGNNTLTGDSGADTLNGGTGTDTMIGGLGDDTYVVNATSDVVTETAVAVNNDLVQSSATYTLSVNVENLTLTGVSAINGTGNASANTMTGNAAANTLNGGAGDDVLDGGSGNDTLIGSSGLDSLTGAAGNDTFKFSSLTDSGDTEATADNVVDFATGDKIDFSLIDADTGTGGNQAFVLDTDLSFSTGEVQQTVSGANLLIEINNDADAAADMAVLLLGVATPLAASDFIL